MPEIDAIQVLVDDPPERVPDWMEITIDSEVASFHTLPPGHLFEQSDGTQGYPGELAKIARQFLSGDLGQDRAEALIDEWLAKWSKA